MSRTRKQKWDDDCPRGCRCDECRDRELARVKRRLREVTEDIPESDNK